MLSASGGVKCLYVIAPLLHNSIILLSSLYMFHGDDVTTLVV